MSLQVDNGVFSSLSLLENRPSHMAVFLNYVIQMNEDPSSLVSIKQEKSHRK